MLDDECWKNTDIFTGFRQYEPYSGEPSVQKTIARVVYDDEGIYVGAMMYDHCPDSIRKELGPRDADRSVIADYFNIDLGPYNDDINGYSFKLTASGIQSDIRRSSGAGGRDLSWDAVWYSSVRLVDSGWIAEIKIPFSAIRFPQEGKKAWGMNLWRYIQRYGEWSSWNYADKSHGTTINYMGEIEGISGIKPPLRVSVTPYISSYLEKISDQQQWQNAFHGGADLKVGLSEAFTLDATLIPDFGQVQSDDRILNLSPYEVKYNERRQFFTEGTDVFNKGGIFYSRRVGSNDTRLINATKISGRTDRGLGIGFFNGITAESTEEMTDPETNSTDEVVTEPLTNYNMLVIDQNLGGGSYASLSNTNVVRSGPATGNNYTANVTATDMRYLSSDRTYSVNAVVAVSQKYFSGTDNIFGHSVNLRGGKTGGRFRMYYSHQSLTNDYDPNDMGYLRRNNEFINSLSLGYNLYDPMGKILNSLNSIKINHEMLHSPRNFTSFSIDLSSTTTFKNFMVLRLGSTITPEGVNDYYEPRTDGMYLKRPPSIEINTKVDTDNRKMLSLTFAAAYEKYFSELNMNRYLIRISPTIRLNNKLNISHSFSLSKFTDDIGFAAITESVIFGVRKAKTTENILSMNYIYSATSYFQARIRHYFSAAGYNAYYYLNEDGTLGADAPDMQSDINTNYFNIDMSYTWRFAPGSELKLVWKNSVYQSGHEILSKLSDNIDALLRAPAVNSFSLKILYYLDYHTLRTRIK